MLTDAQVRGRLDESTRDDDRIGALRRQDHLAARIGIRSGLRLAYAIRLSDSTGTPSF